MRISDKNIKEMLQKYMDGMTSVEEENMLAIYFRKLRHKKAPDGISDDDWRAYREMFAMFYVKKEQRFSFYIRYCAAAAIVLLVMIGAWQWLDGPGHQQPYNGNDMALTAYGDTTVNKVCPDTSKTEIMRVIFPPDHRDMKKKSIKNKPMRNVPPVPRHYLAQSGADDSVTVDMDDAVRQADLLMHAVYVQQQSELYDIICQYAADVAELEEDTDDMEIY